MVVQRGEVWWADLGGPAGSEPGYRRPVVIVQSDAFNRSRIDTAIGVVLTTNLGLVQAPGNVLVPGKDAGLRRDSVANVSQLATLDREALTDRAGRLPNKLMVAVDDGLRLVLGLRRAG